MSRGIRHKLPVLAWLYLFVAEISSLKLKTKNQIEGIQLNDISTKIKKKLKTYNLQMLQPQVLKMQSHQKKRLKPLKKFVIMLDQKYIRKKTQCILLGNLRDRYKEVCNIKVTNNAVCCVGVFTGHNKKQCFILSLLKISIKT